jgi:hypothetical protein
LTEPSEKKLKLLKPEEIPEVILDTDSDELEDDSNETVVGEEDYDFDGSGQPLLQRGGAPSLNIYTGGLNAAIAAEMPHGPSPSDVSEEEEKQNEPDELTVQQEVSLQWTLTSRPRKRRVCNYAGHPNGKKSNELPNISDSSGLRSIFLLFFTGVIVLLVAETN